MENDLLRSRSRLEHNDYLESDLLSDTEDRASSAEEFQWSPILPVEFFKLFISDDFETKMAEHT